MSDSLIDPAHDVLPGKRKRRVFVWFFLALNLLFIWWIISVGRDANEEIATCASQACKDGVETGTGIGVILILFVWAVVDVVVGLPVSM